MNRFAVSTAALLFSLAACGDDAPEETPAAAPPASAATTEAPAAAPATATATAPVADGAMLDPDQASREQLVTVPGLNEQTADALIAARPFTDMRDVDRALAAAGLSEQQREAAYERLWKPLDLNTASAEEILLIPRVGARMQHEFEEYRPYRGMEQFRREIGKYVDDAEVARLERYVTIR